MSHVEPTTETEPRATELSVAFKSPNHWEREAVLKDPQCPAHLAEAGCDDPNIFVRLRAVEHPEVPLKSAWKVFLRADQDVQRVWHDSYPDGIEYWKKPRRGPPPWSFGRRIWAPDHGVVVYSTRIILVIGDSMWNYNWEQVSPLLGSPMLPNHKEFILTPFLTEFSQSEDVDLRAAAAKHRMATAEMRTRLATDADARVRAALARNPEATGTILSQLGSDPEPHVRQAATQRLLETL